MEDLNTKLNFNNPIIISQVISRLTTALHEITDDLILEKNEYKLLKEKCSTSNNNVSIVAAEGILDIARNGNALVTKTLLTDFITIMSTTKCSTNLIYLINNLLLIDLDYNLANTNVPKCFFNLRLPQHPFIIMLHEEPTSWPLILKEIIWSYQTVDKTKISFYDQLYKAVFLYIMCHNQDRQLFTLKQKLWSFIVRKESLCNTNFIITYLLQWILMESPQSIQTSSNLLVELCHIQNNKNIIDSNLLVLLQTSALHQLILNTFDPKEIILSLLNSLENHTEELTLYPCLLIISKCIIQCPVVHLLNLLKLYKAMILKVKLDAITRNVVKASLLPWIANPSELFSDTIKYAEKLFVFMENLEPNLKVNGFIQLTQTLKQFLNTNSDIYFSIEIYASLERCKNINDLINWIRKLQESPGFFILQFFNFLMGLFLTKFDNIDITVSVFKLLLKCVEYNRSLSSNLLILILYKLTKTTDPFLHYTLFKAIPQLAVSKDNHQKILNTLKALTTGRKVLTTFSTTLMFEFWKINNKCYSHLENLLIAPYNSQDENQWEFYVTRAHVLKQLCALKPELYGKELVAHLSKILNVCNNADGALACALALDGITFLCKSEIIDAVTTWASLAPMLQNEVRVPVIKSFCSLVAEIPTLSYSESFPQMIDEIIAKLWNYILCNPNEEVWSAAFNSLTHFTVDEIVAKLPDEFLDEEHITIRKNSQIVPGTCWIPLLKNCTKSKLNIVGDFLIKLIYKEISSYLKFVYQVKGTREPVDYSYLPVNSVVRGLSMYIKSQVIKWKQHVNKEVYFQCLRIFSQEYSKPLPPLDWCFLQELFHEVETKEYSIHIAAHQVILSGTARRFIVNYIEVLGNDQTIPDALLIYKNLKFIANSVQPFTLKPFLEVSILKMVELFKMGDEAILNDALKDIANTLKNEDIQESNKVLIAEIIGIIFIDSDFNSKLYKTLLKVVVLFPSQCIDTLLCVNSANERDVSFLKQIITVRCELARTTKKSPLNNLSKIMENLSSFEEVKTHLLQEFAEVFKEQINNTDCVLWMYELLGQIQAITAEKAKQTHISFMCDIFILAVVIFSGHSVFLNSFTKLEPMYDLFPRAAATLFDVNQWSICTVQALEWFYHMATENILAKRKTLFIRSLQALRYDPEFYKNLKWTKYLNVECSSL